MRQGSKGKMSGMNMIVPTMSSTRLFLWNERCPASWPTTNHWRGERRGGGSTLGRVPQSPSCQPMHQCPRPTLPPPPRPRPPLRSTHPSESRPRECPRKGEHVPGRDRDEVEASRHGDDGRQDCAPSLAVIQLKDLQAGRQNGWTREAGSDGWWLVGDGDGAGKSFVVENARTRQSSASN